MRQVPELHRDAPRLLDAQGATTHQHPSRERWHDDASNVTCLSSTAQGAWRAYTYERAAIDALCEKYYGLQPRVGWLATWGGGYAIADKKTGSNIIWSNGRRDPWHGGGFLRQAPHSTA